MPSKKKQQPVAPESLPPELELRDLPVSEETDAQIVGGSAAAPAPDLSGSLSMATLTNASRSVHTSPLAPITNVKG